KHSKPSGSAGQRVGKGAEFASALTVVMMKQQLAILEDALRVANDVSFGVARAIRNLPLSAIGGVVANVSNSSCSPYDNGLILCSEARTGGTITLGNVIVTDWARDDFVSDPISDHEKSHTVQSAVLGNDSYALLWLSGLGTSLLWGQYHGGGGCLNVLETGAAPGGGYETC